MQEKLERGDATDVSSYERTPEGWYVFPHMAVVGQDYCDAQTEEWIWVVGQFAGEARYVGAPLPQGRDLLTDARFTYHWLR
jgi:hypothetical protein